MLVGIYNGATAMENNTVSLQKIKNRITTLSSYFTSEFISKRIENRVPKKYLYTHVYSIIHKSKRYKQPRYSMTEGYTKCGV
jgi:hypothetical protein